MDTERVQYMSCVDEPIGSFSPFLKSVKSSDHEYGPSRCEKARSLLRLKTMIEGVASVTEIVTEVSLVVSGMVKMCKLGYAQETSPWPQAHGKGRQVTLSHCELMAHVESKSLVRPIMVQVVRKSLSAINHQQKGLTPY